MRARALKFLIAALVLLLAGVLVRGLSLAGYEPERSDHYLWGAFHVHSTLSDGLLPLEGVAAEAREARVAFVLLSEHGKPDPKGALVDTTIDGVRFLGGSEVGLPEGHVIVSNPAEVPHYALPPFPPDAVEDVAEWGGLSIVTYPEDPEVRWTYWENDLRPNGLEIVNVTSYFRASSFWQKLDWAIFSVFTPHYYVSAYEPPDEALARWDQLLERAPVSGFYAANAHGGFPLPGGTAILFPSYATAFRYAGLGIDPRYRAAPEEAIRQGDFFSIVRSAGEPQRFDFELEDGEVRVRLETRALAARIDLKENGRLVASSRDGRVAWTARSPGVYRAEVYLEDHPLLRPDVPWILSNPIYFGVAYPEPLEPAPDCAPLTTLPLERFGVEKDADSEATLDHRFGTLDLKYTLARSTPEAVDRWVALAYREPLDLTGTHGVRLVASGSEVMRYWVEVRTSDASYYGTFKVRPGDPSPIVVPWEHFYRVGGGREPLPLARIGAVFLTVNTSSSQTGFSSELTVHEMGWCR